MVTAERRNNGGLIGKGHLVFGVWWEEALQHGSGTVEDRCTLTTDLDTNVDFIEINKLSRDSTNV